MPGKQSEQNRMCHEIGQPEISELPAALLGLLPAQAQHQDTHVGAVEE